MPTPSRPLRLLFVCVENSNRSQMAEAFARIHGGDRVEAHSAGSRPSGRVNPKAIEAMRELGYDLAAHQSKSIEQVLAESAGEPFDAVVTMGCADSCPYAPSRHREDWQIPNPRELPPEQFREVRDLIDQKVAELIRRLSPEG
jgi:arsenate reductase (thioredoxin)